MINFYNKIFKSELSRRQAGVLIFVASVLWSTGGLLIKLIDWSPFVTAGIRSIFAAMLVGAFIGFRNIRFNKTILLGAAVLCYTLVSFVVANKYTSAANAIALQYTAPVYAMLYSVIFMRKRPKAKDIFTITFTLLGIFLFFIDSFDGDGALGNLIAITSGVGFAGVSIIYSQGKEDNLQYAFWGQVLTVMVGLPFILLISPPVLTAGSVAAVVFMGFFQLGLGYAVYATAMRAATALDGTLISMLEPILNPIWVFLVLREFPGWWAVLGAATVITSVTLWSVSNARED